MKLLLCAICNDIIPLRVGELSTCKCGSCSGQYLRDGLNAAVSGRRGSMFVLGFNNFSLVEALRAQLADGDLPTKQGRRFEAFIIPEGAPSVTYNWE